MCATHRRIGGIAHGIALKVVVLRLPEASVGVARVIQRAVRKAARVVTHGVYGLGGYTGRRLEIAVVHTDVAVVVTLDDTGDVDIVLNDGNHKHGVVLARVDVARIVRAGDGALEPRTAVGAGGYSAHIACVACAHRNIGCRVGVAVGGREAVKHLGPVVDGARDTAGVHGLARNGTHGDVVGVLHGRIAVGTRIIQDINAGIRVAQRRDATVLDGRALGSSHDCAQVEALATQAGDTGGGVVDDASARNLAIVDDAAFGLAGDHTARQAGVGDERHRIVGRCDGARAIGDLHVGDRGVLGVPHDVAAAEVGAHVAVSKVDVMDVGAVRGGEQAGVCCGNPKITLVVKACDSVARTVKLAFEGAVDGAERERPDLRDDVVNIVGRQVEVDVQANSLPLELAAVISARRKNDGDEVGHRVDLVHPARRSGLAVHHDERNAQGRDDSRPFHDMPPYIGHKPVQEGYRAMSHSAGHPSASKIEVWLFSYWTPCTLAVSPYPLAGPYCAWAAAVSRRMAVQTGSEV